MDAPATRLGYPQWGLGAPRGLELEPRSVGAPRTVGPTVDNPGTALRRADYERLRVKGVHPAAILGRVMFATTKLFPRGGRDAGEDYPESNREAARVYLRAGALERRRQAHRGDAAAGRPDAAGVFGVRRTRRRLRHVGGAPLSVRAAVGDRGRAGLCDAAGGVRPVRGEGRARPLGGGPAPVDVELRVVSGAP